MVSLLSEAHNVYSCRLAEETAAKPVLCQHRKLSSFLFTLESSLFKELDYYCFANVL